MQDPAKIIVCLPAYNEAANLPKLLERFERVFSELDFPHRYIVCDDGSTDNTPELLREWQQRVTMEILTHSPNQGLGATIRDVLKAGTEAASPGDAILTMDADNTHPPEILPEIIALYSTEADIVIASRYQPGAYVRGLSAFRRFASGGAGILFRLILPMKGVKDYTCGYRLYRAPLLKKTFELYGDELVTESGFSCMADLLLKMRPFRPVCKEAALPLHYDVKEGESKMRVGRTILNTLRLIARRRLGIGIRRP